MTSCRSMFLIQFGDPRLVNWESLLLKFTMSYSGMQHINLTSTMLRETRKGKLSFPNKLIHFMNLTLNLVKSLYLIKKRMGFPKFNFQSSFSYPNHLWGELPEAVNKLIIDYNEKVKVPYPKHISMVATLNLKQLWVNLIQIPSQFTLMTMTILPITHILKTLLKQWSMSVKLMVEFTHQTLTLFATF